MRLASNGDSMHDNSSLISENERGKTMNNGCLTQNMLVRLICIPNHYDKKVNYYVSQVKLSEDVLFFGPLSFSLQSDNVL